MRFLLVDRVLQITDRTQVRGLKHVTREDYYLCQSDEGERYFFVPSLMGETLGQLAAWYVMYEQNFKRRPVAGVVARSQVHRRVYRGETMQLHAVIDELDDQAVLYHGAIYVHDEKVFTLEGALGPLLPMEDFIDHADVQQQWQEINRPGEWLSAASSESYQENARQTSPICGRMLFDHIVSDE